MNETEAGILGGKSFGFERVPSGGEPSVVFRENVAILTGSEPYLTLSNQTLLALESLAQGVGAVPEDNDDEPISLAAFVDALQTGELPITKGEWRRAAAAICFMRAASGGQSCAEYDEAIVLAKRIRFDRALALSIASGKLSLILHEDGGFKVGLPGWAHWDDDDDSAVDLSEFEALL